MTTPHHATPSDWAWLEGNSTVNRCDAAWSRGLIELRARVEALELAHRIQSGTLTPAEQAELGVVSAVDMKAAMQRATTEARDAAMDEVHAALVGLRDCAPDSLKSTIHALFELDPMDELRAASAEARPGGLVERVGAVIEWGFDANQDPEGIARAAIRKVAAWLRENDAKREMGGDAAAAAELLEQEANRG